MNIKNILTSLGMIVFVGAAVAGATGAFFSDTAVSEANSFTAGEVDLVMSVPSSNDTEFTTSGFTFSLADIMPLDSGDVTYGLTNAEEPAKVCVRLTDKTNPTAANTAFASLMSFKTGNEPLVYGEWKELADFVKGGTANFNLDYCFGEYDGTACVIDEDAVYNPAQNGRIKMDVEFYAEQTENNDFECDDLNPAKVGANLTTYVAPSICTTTVTPEGSINTAITNATAGNTICVESGTYAGPVNITKGITLASVSGPGATTIDGGVKITSSGVTVTGFNVLAGVVPAEPNPVGFYVASGDNIGISFNSIDGESLSQSSGVITPTGAAYTNVVVEKNVFKNLLRGMYINPIASGAINVRYNDFLASNAIGIAGYNGAYLWRNEFSAPEALGVDSSYDSNPTTVEENNFLNGADINVYGTLTNKVDAPNNFFNLSGVNQTTSGEVNITPEAGTQFSHL